MLQVLSDMLAAADKQRVTLIGLLDLSSAFDCIENALLLHRLHHFRLSDAMLQGLNDVV